MAVGSDGFACLFSDSGFADSPSVERLAGLEELLCRGSVSCHEHDCGGSGTVSSVLCNVNLFSQLQLLNWLSRPLSS